MDENTPSQEAEPQVESPATTADILKSDDVQAVISRIRQSNELPAPEPDDSEHVEQEETSSETTERQETAETKPDEQPVSWITPEHVEKAKAYGLDALDLAEEFPSAAEFRRWASLADRANARRQPTVEQPQPKKAETSAEPNTTDKFVDGKINPAYFEARPDEYDEDTVLAMKKLREQEDFREQYEADKRAAAEAKEQELQAQLEWALHDALDAKDGFYGKSVDERGKPVNVGPKEAERRGAVIAQVKEQLNIYAGQGRPAPSLNVLVRQAEQIALSEELASYEQQARDAQRQDKLEAVADQSRRIRRTASSVGAKRAYVNSPPANAGTTESIYKSPEVQAVIRQIAEQNGF